MKIRQGFVSNSSSSSFIVAWDKKPETAEEIKEILFNNYDNITHMYNDEEYDTLEVAKIILEDTQVETEERIKEEFGNSVSLYNGTWYETPYKGDEKLMSLAIDEDRISRQELDRFDTFLRKYSWEERAKIKTIIERKKKLSRISKDKTTELTEEEKTFFDTDKKHKDAQNRCWNNKYIIELIDKSYKSFVEDNKGKFITTYEYSDNDGAINSHLEHSGTFDNLTHIKISNH